MSGAIDMMGSCAQTYFPDGAVVRVVMNGWMVQAMARKILHVASLHPVGYIGWV